MKTYTVMQYIWVTNTLEEVLSSRRQKANSLLVGSLSIANYVFPPSADADGLPRLRRCTCDTAKLEVRISEEHQIP
jgi:hypothetical protein